MLPEIIANANTLLTSFGLRADGGGVVVAGGEGGGELMKKELYLYNAVQSAYPLPVWFDCVWSGLCPAPVLRG